MARSHQEKAEPGSVADAAREEPRAKATHAGPVSVVDQVPTAGKESIP
jgi:hypothetical protein